MDAVINLVGIMHENKVGRVDLPGARAAFSSGSISSCRARSSTPAANRACAACCT